MLKYMSAHSECFSLKNYTSTNQHTYKCRRTEPTLSSSWNSKLL